MRCDELIEDKVAVLYGDADADAQRRVGEHNAGCPACREETAAMRGVRRSLASWKLPATLRPRRPWRRAPLFQGWALPAAAALLCAVGGGLALARAEVRYAAGEFSLRFGHDAPQTDVAQMIERQEQRRREELRALREELLAARAPQPVPASARGDALLGRVQALIDASEGRQRAALRAGIDLLERRRQYDLARIKTGFSYLEGRSGQDMANAMKAVSYVLASQPGASEPVSRLR